MAEDWKEETASKKSDPGEDGGKVSRSAEGRRPELVAISGLRFWATFLLLAGSVIESLWIDDGHQVKHPMRVCNSKPLTAY